MPAKSKRDEEKWDKAKELAAEQGHKEDYAYIMGIYKKMKPDQFKNKSALVAAKTYPAARKEILDHLKSKGWAVNDRLKIPHATSPRKDIKLFFKKQAVYGIFNYSGFNPSLKDTHSLPVDIRKVDGPRFERLLEKWKSMEHNKAAQALITATLDFAKAAGCEKLPPALREQCEKKQNGGKSKSDDKKDDKKKDEEKSDDKKDKGDKKLPPWLKDKGDKKDDKKKDDKKKAAIAQRITQRHQKAGLTQRVAERHVQAAVSPEAQSAFDNEVLPKILRPILEGCQDEVAQTMRAIGSGKFPDQRFEYGVMRHKPLSMRDDQFLREVKNAYVSWEGRRKMRELVHSARV